MEELVNLIESEMYWMRKVEYKKTNPKESHGASTRECPIRNLRLLGEVLRTFNRCNHAFNR